MEGSFADELILRGEHGSAECGPSRRVNRSVIPSIFGLMVHDASVRDSDREGLIGFVLVRRCSLERSRLGARLREASTVGGLASRWVSVLRGGEPERFSAELLLAAAKGDADALRSVGVTLSSQSIFVTRIAICRGRSSRSTSTDGDGAFFGACRGHLSFERR